jgi:hypothetical protein
MAATVLITIAANGACSSGSGDDDESADDTTPPGWTATTLDRTTDEGSTGGGSQGSEGSEGADQITTTIADAEASPEQLVEATYEAYWERREHAIKFPDADDTSLGEVASGAALSELTDTVASLEQVGQQGQFGALDSHHVYEVELLGTTTATVSDCALSDARIVVGATGEVVRTDPPDGKPFIYTATLHYGDDGRWRIDDLSRVPLMGDQFCSNDGPVGQGS